MNPHYSIIIPVYNHLDLTLQCLGSIERNSNMKSLEIILVDDGSSDGTTDWATGWERVSRLHFIGHEKREGFTRSCNEGMKQARGDYIVLLNNDTLVTPDWLQHLENSLLEARRRYKNPNFALVGPVSNDVPGMQQVKISIPPEETDDFGPKYYSLNKDKLKPALFLSGFCLMLTRQLYRKIGGFDERFSPGGYEDRDLCLRARLEGYLGIVALDTFIYHHGHRTIDEFPELDRGHINRWKYFEKWRDDKPKKLVAMYYVQDTKYLRESLNSIDDAVDEIVMLDSSHKAESITRDFPKVVICQDAPLGKVSKRHIIMPQALKLARSRDPDWLLLMSDDEIMDDRFTREYAEKLMNPLIPDIMGYDFLEFAAQDKYFYPNPFPRHAMMRNIPEDSPDYFLPEDFTGMCPLRIRGFRDTPKGTTLLPWQEKNDIALVTIMKDEAKYLDSFLEHIHLAFDEIILVDTGSRDSSKEVAQRWGAKVADFKWKDHFGMARNFALNQTNAEWICHLDIDEKLEDMRKIYEMVNSGKDAFLFTIMDLHPGRKMAFPESIRLFRKMKGVHYEGMIHETVVESLTKIPALKMDRASTRIVHYGRLRPGAEKKKARYREMAEDMMRRERNNPLPHFHLALMERDALHMEQALRHIQEAAKLGWQKPNIRLELANTHLQAAYVVYQTLKDIDPGHPYYEEIMGKLEMLRRFFPQ